MTIAIVSPALLKPLTEVTVKIPAPHQTLVNSIVI